MTEFCSEITQLLAEVAAGKEGAKDQLIQCVYQDLHAKARFLLIFEPRDLSWGATDLVHEAFLRLFKGSVPARDRAYFFACAAQAMRWLLIEHARSPERKNRNKRIPLDDVLDRLQHTQQVDMEALDNALNELEAFAPRECEVVMLRLFGGLRVKEVAAQLEVSVPTVEKDWTWAKSWLHRRLKGGENDR